MNAALLLAIALLIVLGVAHSYLGERYILVRLFRRTDLPHLRGSDTFTRQTLRFAWHITSVAWFGIATLLFLLARSDGPLPTADIGAVVAVTALISSIVALVGARGRHASWIVFLIIAGLVWYGTHLSGGGSRG